MEAGARKSTRSLFWYFLIGQEDGALESFASWHSALVSTVLTICLWIKKEIKMLWKQHRNPYFGAIWTTDILGYEQQPPPLFTIAEPEGWRVKTVLAEKCSDFQTYVSSSV